MAGSWIGFNQCLLRQNDDKEQLAGHFKSLLYMHQCQNLKRGTAMQAGSIDLKAKSKVKEFGRIRRLDKSSRIFLVASGEGEMLEMLGSFVGEEIDGSHFTSLADALEVEHVDDLLALVEQVPKYLGSVRLFGVLIDADPTTSVVREVIIVAEEGERRRVIVRKDINGVFEDSVSALDIAGWIEAKF
jgi:hypothetical protein